MQIEYVTISELSPAKYNPRRISDKQMAGLKESLSRFGFVDPVVANRRGNVIIGGHQRVRAWSELGHESIPVYWVDLPEEKERELNIRLNANTGEWDKDLLTEWFSEAELDEWGLSIDVSWPETEGLTDPDAVPELPVEPTTKPGDFFQLGEHRLLCGDASLRDDVARLMGEEKGQLVFTDPPYNVDYHSPDGNTYESTKYGGTGGKIFNDNKTDAECIEFYSAILKNLHAFTDDSAAIYWWFASSNYQLSEKAFAAAGWRISQMLVWLKESMVLARSQDYHRCYEPCLLGWKKGKKHYVRPYPNNLKDCFAASTDDYREAMDVWYEKRDITSEYVHPTQKPVSLATRALKKHSGDGFIVLDFFGGSGSTLIACERQRRKCRTMELDPKYCDVIIQRWENFTGQKAIKL